MLDVTIMYTKWASIETTAFVDEAEFWVYINEWGVKYVMPKEDSLFYTVITHLRAAPAGRTAINRGN